ncbi:hypothetical protein PHLGIDRAFT_18992 [Phlebiopsis gigantea 11061_1 CR5-6]|uniref:NAD-dependent epimerase/dehydratase domain-containing protein n=1 Tax=Phlebiopsis gigantea (strain 11061_1 CR5-6) TaxID=745531 RepID=A0A0C3S9F2_PHLG1|nr:hypothetical protein PHLGIDRAFT_18992 [Phlebiopsis gigantea 11061_1 CR5-6]
MKLAVTGCNGRVGRRVCKAALDAGHVVHGIDSVGPPTDLEHAVHPNFAFSRVDLRDYDTTVEALQGSDAVVQLAAIPTPTDYRVHTHNTYVRLPVGTS